MKDVYHHTAVLKKEGFVHFGINKTSAQLYGDDPKDIMNVELQLHKDQTIPVKNFHTKIKHSDYWGWYDNKEERFTLIFPQYFLLNMCFPYGMSAEEERNYGKAYRLTVKQKI